ncbi:hypothetical protein Tther_00864 [Tepidimonas thermarum]|uniref:VCBS repeat-containing protein n=1 Tax=Tepidimonas thermarum TaxID=335431 RepID=A0A554X447_9BURK|nr:hypothetical protein [Tepidimonas thermarum]TSE30624.1 hypothetical protein Tther_00864 [Tepidimonas thermarum]
MKIAHSTVALDSQAERAVRTQTQTRWQVWRSPPPSPAPRPSALLQLSPRAAASRPDAVPGSAVGRPAHDSRATAHAADDTRVSADTPDDGLEPRLRTLARMIEALTGLRVRVFRAEAWQPSRPADGGPAIPAADTTATAPTWGLAYDHVEIRTESHTVAFEARGRVALADGTAIDFELRLALRSETVDVRALSLRAGGAAQRLQDPLVLALDGAPPTLTDMRFAFDLDADGSPESVPFVASGSGFLALDRNGNGSIDDGRELFGALSGDGFAELAALDNDGNGWIDAGDAAFEQLRVWTRDGGTDRLQTLAEAGVGALHLGRVATPFALGEAGRLRSSGLYLTEAGQARPLQQIDLAV